MDANGAGTGARDGQEPVLPVPEGKGDEGKGKGQGVHGLPAQDGQGASVLCSVQQEPEKDGGITVVSWNANGLRARLAQQQYSFLLTADGGPKYDVVCIQETKADEVQLKIPADLRAAYPYRCYESTRLRKGQSGTALWSTLKVVGRIPAPAADVEGRVCAADFGSFVAASVYVPNSGTKHAFRTGLWHATFSKYLDYLGSFGKPSVVCMDANVCHEDVDIYAPGKHRNKVAGFYDIERQQFAHYLAARGYRDAFRVVHPLAAGAYTWFNPRVPQMRERNLGWRLDVVLVGRGAHVCACDHLGHVRGSDHIPVVARVRFPDPEPDPEPDPAGQEERAVQAPRLRPRPRPRHFCNDWLRPHSALLEQLSAACSLTAAAHRALKHEWAARDAATCTPGTEAQDKDDTCSAGDASLLAFAQQSLHLGELGLAQREQTRSFFCAEAPATRT